MSKGWVTRKGKNVLVLMEEETPWPLVEKKLTEAKQYFAKYDQEHQKALEEATDESVKTSLTQEYDTVKDAHEDTVKKGEQYIQDQKITSYSPNPPQNLDITSLIASLQLPKVELGKFDGDIIEYPSFIRRFKLAVEEVTQDSQRRLDILQSVCEGEAGSLIRDCIFIEPAQEGYDKARKLLEQRYGNPFVVTQRHMEKLSNFKNITAGETEKLQQFSDCLNSTIKTLDSLNNLKELNTHQNMLMVIGKLPYNLQYHIQKIMTESNNPSITLLADTITQASERSNHPVWGQIRRGVSHGGSSHREQAMKSREQRDKSTASRNFNITNEPGKCLHCNSTEHYISSCQSFRRSSSEEKMKVVQGNGLCYNCLRKHNARDCTSTGRCRTCGRRHHTELHDCNFSYRSTSNVSNRTNQTVMNIQTEEVQAEDGEEKKMAENTVQTYLSGKTDNRSSKTFLSMVTVRVQEPGKREGIQTGALLDTGSSESWIHVDVLKDLKVREEKGRSKSVKLQTVSGTEQVEVRQVKLEVSGVCRGQRRYRKEVIFNVKQEFPEISNNVTQEDLKDYKHLKTLPLEVKRKEVKMIIGEDAADLMMPLELRRGRRMTEPYAVRTPLGWALNGTIKATKVTTGVTTFFTHSQYDEENNLDNQVERFWKIEHNEVTQDYSQEDKRTIELWKTTSQKDGEHYSMKIPFRDRTEIETNLPNSKEVAETRLKSLTRRLSRDEKLAKRYAREMEILLEKKYVEKVAIIDKSPRWYLPHFPVFNENKPDKLRVVFDCAAKCKQKSLNDYVMQGPEQTNNMVGILMRFRERPIAIQADVKEMFYQVRVNVQDRDMLRFIWHRDGLDQPPEEFRFTVHPFGGVWCPSIATYAMRQTAEDHKDDFPAEVVRAVKEDFYVDDFVKSLESTEEASNMVKQIDRLLQLGGFNLTKWNASSREVLKTINEEDRAKELQAVNLMEDELPGSRALGIKWYMETDEIGVDVKIKERPNTKRGILSLLSSTFDPLGIVSPVILKARLILQEEHRRQLHWDEKISEESERDWEVWKKELTKLTEFKLARCTRPAWYQSGNKVTLHHFSDASPKGYGMVTYVRYEQNKQYHVALISGKSRTAPLKGVTLPRLELTAAHLAAKMDALVRQQMTMKIEESYFWTDSSIVLYYLSNTRKRFPTYVQNRVTEILELTDVRQWRYVPTSENPADETTRGENAGQLLDSKTWKIGPEFLWKEEKEWPKNIIQKVEEVKETTVMYIGKEKTVTEKILGRTSSWKKAKRIMSWVLKAKRQFKELLTKKRQTRAQTILKERLEIQDEQEAERYLIRETQNEAFQEDNKVLAELNVKKDEYGILRVLGRTGNRLDVSQNPAILPYQSPISHLVVKEVHERGHISREHTVAEVRSKYWILKTRKKVKSVLHKCHHCRRRDARPLQERMSDLPQDRLESESPLFWTCGIDVFGPIEIRKGRGVQKRYGCLFICLTTGAIHIEILPNMESDTFINGLVRFINRRGKPKRIRTDNGSNFFGGLQEMKQSIREWNEKVGEQLQQKEIEWKFNPPKASHFGGRWERMIRTVRRTLNGLLGGKELIYLGEDSLNTLMTEVENIVNGRPITPSSEDPNDLEALTPNHLMLLRSNHQGPMGLFQDIEMYGRRRWRQVQHLANQFWSRWKREYLGEVQKRDKWTESKNPKIKEGDLVVLTDDNIHKSKWQLGRVIKLISSEDGIIRRIQIKTKMGVYDRPIQKVCLIEGV